MADAIKYDCGDERKLTAAAAIAAGELWQMPSGRAGVYQGANAAASGDVVCFDTENDIYIVPKTASIVILDGGPVYWDNSASKAHFKQVDDQDYYLGTAYGDAASSDTTMKVKLNCRPSYKVDLIRDPFTPVPVGTSAAGGFGFPRIYGGAVGLFLTATSEAQKVDALSVDGFANAANGIVEFAVRFPTGGSGSASDYSIGIASGTHATDADSIAQHLFMHTDGAATDIKFQSKDGTTTVTATDSTVDYTAGSANTNRVEVWFDMRAPGSVKIYVDGVRVLSGTTFDVSAAASTWKLLAHAEKTTGTETGDVIVDWLRVRTSEQ